MLATSSPIAIHPQNWKRCVHRFGKHWFPRRSSRQSIKVLPRAGYGEILMMRLDAKLLEQIFVGRLEAVGVERESIAHVVGSLLQTSLRGVDSHGIRLFPHYVRASRSGRINVAPRITIKSTGNSTAILDADHAFGHRAGANAI